MNVLTPEPTKPKDPETPKATRRRRSKNAPLSYERMAILIAAAEGRIDFEDVSDAVISDTVGEILIKKSTLYHHLKELINEEYLLDRPYIELTDKGVHTLRAELSRIENQRLILKLRLRL